VTLIAAFGLLTGFAIGETLDIQMRDTYFVIANLHLLILLIFTIATAYFLTIGLKRIARLNRILKIISITMAGLTGLVLAGLLTITIGTLATSPLIGQNMSTYGMIVLIFGLTLLFLIRTREIWRLK
jgi:hypothetical protein